MFTFAFKSHKYVYTTTQGQTSIDGEIRNTIRLSADSTLLLELCSPMNLRKIRHLWAAAQVYDHLREGTSPIHLSDEFVSKVTSYVRTKSENRSKEEAHFGIGVCLSHPMLTEGGTLEALFNVIFDSNKDEVARLRWFMEKAKACTTEGQDSYAWLRRGLKGDKVPE